MSLRTKTLIIIGAILAGLIAILLVASQTVLLRSFEQLEEQNTREDVQRFLNALSDQLAQLSSTAADYAVWDDTFAFVRDGSKDYVQINLGDDTFSNLGVNLMAFVDAGGAVIFSKTVDLESASEIPSPEDFEAKLRPDSPLFDLPTVDSTVTGVLLTAGGPMLVASRPILDSLREQEPRGTLIFGQFLDDARIGQLSDSLRLSIKVKRYDDPQLPDDFANARAALADQSPIVVSPLNRDQIAGYGVINDLYGSAALIARVQATRDIYTQGQMTIMLFITLLIISGLIFAAGIALLLERGVLSRLTHLSRDVRVISGNLSGRVEVAGSDELSSLASDINHMLAARKQAEEALRFSEERFRLISQVANDALYDWDMQTGYVWRSEGYKRLCSPDEPIGDTHNWWREHLHPDDYARTVASLEGAFHNSEQVWAEEYRFRRQNGEYAYIAERGLIVYEANGKAVRMMGALSIGLKIMV